jgi:hypothetical protein
VLPAASSAVTVTLLGEPAVAVPGALTVKRVAAPALTMIVAVVPVVERVIVSVAVTARAPTVFRVTGNIPVPLVRVVSAGSIAALSELVKCTVPG